MARHPASAFSLHLVSDLDGTWIPAPEQMAGLGRLEAFLAAHPGIILTFATGRGLASALDLLERRVGHLPQHLVTDVGTTLHHRTAQGGWVEDLAYARWVAGRWPEDLKDRLARAGWPEGVRPQPGVPASRRVALELEPGGDLQLAAARLRALLGRLGVEAEVLPSDRRYLDLLPPGVDKGSAVRHLGIPLPVMACGDSENDLGLWRVADLPVLMADSTLPLPRPGPPWDRMVRAGAPGPEGILEVLVERGWRLGLSNGRSR